MNDVRDALGNRGFGAFLRAQRPPDDGPDIQTKRTSAAGSMPIALETTQRIESLRGTGAPLAASVRSYFEPRFGRDFSGVRVHTGATADQTSRSLSARAYTVGSDIAFSEGAFSPESDDGRRLLAHELTHVVQQTNGQLAAPAVQRQRRKRRDRPRGVKFQYSVHVTSALSADQLILEFLKQYYGLKTLSEAADEKKKRGWHWTGQNPTGASKEDAAKGYKLIWVTDRSAVGKEPTSGAKEKDYMKRLPKEESDRMNAAIDEEFWRRTNYKPRERLGSSADDQRMAQYWSDIRDELVQLREKIDSFSPAVKEFLFRSDGPVLEPKDYANAVRIGEILSEFSPAELADYKSKVVGRTTDWNVFEESLKHYLVERDVRKEKLEARETIKTKLYGLEELYQTYRDYREAVTIEELAGSGIGLVAPAPIGAIGAKARRDAKTLKAELDANLPLHGFRDIAEFEKYIRDYELAFQTETVAIAFDLLAQYEHVLYEEEIRYKDPANVSALYQRLSQTQAKKHYEAAAGQSAFARSIQPEPEYKGYLPGQFQLKQEYEAKAAASRRLAESEFAAATPDEPLLKHKDFPRERLARATLSEPAPVDEDLAALGMAASLITPGAVAYALPPPPGFQSILLNYIEDRREDIRKTRGYLTKYPHKIFDLDDLLKVSYQVQEIAPGSIFDLIIRDKIRDKTISEAIWNIVVAVIAIALGILSFGTGTVAVLATIGAFGISAYQALKEFEEYEIKSSAHHVGFYSKDPSFAWVIVAAVGAGLDLAAVGSAIKAMRTAVTTFNEAGAAGDLIKLEKDLKGIAEVSDQLRANMMKAAAAELQYRKAVSGLLATTGRLNAILLPVEEIRRLVAVAYYLAKRGIIAFDKFLLELKAQKLLGSIENLTAPELQVLKKAFKEGVEKARTGLLKYDDLSKTVKQAYTAEQVEEIALKGSLLGYTDREIVGFLEFASAAGPGPVPTLGPRLVGSSTEPTVWVNLGKGKGRGTYHPHGSYWFERRTAEGVEIPLSWAESLGYRRTRTPRTVRPIEPTVISGRQVESLGAAHPRSGKTVSATARDPTAVKTTAIRPDIDEATGYKHLLEQGEIGLQRPFGANVKGVDSITVRVEFDQAGRPVSAKIYLNDVTTPTSAKGAKASHAQWKGELDDALGPGRLDLNDPALEAVIHQARKDNEVYVRVVRVDSPGASGGTPVVNISPSEVTRVP